MRFFLDQDIYGLTVKFLIELGHDVVTASEAGLSKAPDYDLLKHSQEQNRILVTRDRDFGGLVFHKNLGSGVIYLRLTPSSMNAVHKELSTVIKSYSENKLHKAFVVVEAGRHRFRKIE